MRQCRHTGEFVWDGKQGKITATYDSSIVRVEYVLNCEKCGLPMATKTTIYESTQSWQQSIGEEK